MQSTLIPSFGSTQQFNGPFYAKLLQNAFGLYIPQSSLNPFFEFIQQLRSTPCATQIALNGLSLQEVLSPFLSRQQLGPPDKFIAPVSDNKRKIIT